MIVSTTELGTYKRCRRQWMINSRNRWGLTRIVSSNPLALGTLVHETLDVWLQMHRAYEAGDSTMLLPPGGLSTLFMQAADMAIKEARVTYERQVGTAMSDSELAPLYETVTQGRCMMDNYQARWGQPVPKGFEIIATEQRCIVPVPGTEHTSEWVWEVEYTDDGLFKDAHAVLREYSDVRLHMLEGKLDAILRETKTGRLFVVDHKTYGQRPREDVLFANEQFLSYHYILLQMAHEMGFDASQVAGVAYDGLWKRATPPKTVDGHKGELADLFSRRLITRPFQELREFQTMVAAQITEMASNPPVYHNRTSDGSCFWACSDNQLCLMMSRGEDWEWLLRKDYKHKETDEDMDPNREAA
jgi:PD-(D/E)XK nuclease superfamily